MPRWLPTHRSRTCRDDLIQIGPDLFCCTPISWLPARSPKTASIVSCATCPVSHFFRCQVAQTLFRFTIHILHQGFTRCRGQTNLCTKLLFADWRPLHCWSPEDTSDWSSADPYSRASTALKKLITRLRDILQGRSIAMCVFSHAPMSHGGDCLSAYSLLFIFLIFGTHTIYDHTSHFLLLNTFLSLACFAWWGVINPLRCLGIQD